MSNMSVAGGSDRPSSAQTSRWSTQTGDSGPEVDLTPATSTSTLVPRNRAMSRTIAKIYVEPGNSNSEYPKSECINIIAESARLLPSGLLHKNSNGDWIASCEAPLTCEAVCIMIQTICPSSYATYGTYTCDSVRELVDLSLTLAYFDYPVDQFKRLAQQVKEVNWNPDGRRNLDEWIYVSRVFGWADLYEAATREVIWSYEARTDEFRGYAYRFLPATLRRTIATRRSRLVTLTQEYLQQIWLKLFTDDQQTMDIIYQRLHPYGIDLRDLSTFPEKFSSPEKIFRVFEKALKDTHQPHSSTTHEVPFAYKAQPAEPPQLQAIGRGNGALGQVDFMGHFKYGAKKLKEKFKPSSTASSQYSVEKVEQSETALSDRWTVSIDRLQRQIADFRAEHCKGLQLESFSGDEEPSFN